jgi:hypothetical protein
VRLVQIHAFRENRDVFGDDRVGVLLYVAENLCDLAIREVLQNLPDEAEVAIGRSLGHDVELMKGRFLRPKDAIEALSQ